MGAAPTVICFLELDVYNFYFGNKILCLPKKKKKSQMNSDFESVGLCYLARKPNNFYIDFVFIFKNLLNI